MSSPYRVSCLVSPNGTREVQSFVAARYVSRYDTAPPLADIYSVVWRGDEIVACMGLEFAGPDGRFQIERVHMVRRTEGLDPPLTVATCVQLSRWVSLPGNENAGVLAPYAAVAYAMQTGRMHAYAEHDAGVHALCVRILRIEFHELDRGGLDISYLREAAHREFYTRGLLKPYRVSLPQMRDALAARLAKLGVEIPEHRA